MIISSSIEGFKKNTNHDICFESRKPRQKYIVAKKEKKSPLDPELPFDDAKQL